jgi:hypothetical protein
MMTDHDSEYVLFTSEGPFPWMITTANFVLTGQNGSEILRIRYEVIPLKGRNKSQSPEEIIRMEPQRTSSVCEFAAKTVEWQCKPYKDQT